MSSVTTSTSTVPAVLYQAKVFGPRKGVVNKYHYIFIKSLKLNLSQNGGVTFNNDWVTNDAQNFVLIDFPASLADKITPINMYTVKNELKQYFATLLNKTPEELEIPAQVIV